MQILLSSLVCVPLYACIYGTDDAHLDKYTESAAFRQTPIVFIIEFDWQLHHVRDICRLEFSNDARRYSHFESCSSRDGSRPATADT